MEPHHRCIWGGLELRERLPDDLELINEHRQHKRDCNHIEHERQQILGHDGKELVGRESLKVVWVKDAPHTCESTCETVQSSEGSWLISSHSTMVAA